jgi:hypothetical protein
MAVLLPAIANPGARILRRGRVARVLPFTAWCAAKRRNCYQLAAKFGEFVTTIQFLISDSRKRV